MAPKSRMEFLTGKCKYARMDTLDKYGKWSLLLYLDKASLGKWASLKEEGILNTLKKDEKDGDYVRLTRPPFKEFRGIKTQLTPPTVTDKEGKVITDWVGNGSDVTAKITVYKFNKQFGGGQGAAIRLEGLQVDNLVPYVTAVSGQDETTRKQADGFPTSPTFPTYDPNKRN